MDNSKYYSLSKNNNIIVKVSSTDSDAEFFSKRGFEDKVDEYVTKVNVLLSRSGSEISKPYSRSSLASSFSSLEPMTEESFNKARDAIIKFNVDYDDANEKLDSIPRRKMEEYITVFPAKHPRLASYADVNKIWSALTVRSTGSFDFDETRTDDSILADMKILYSMLHDAEERNDDTVIKNFLKAIGDGWDETLSLVL